MARNLTKHPQYFGGYLNMARHNIFRISNHIADKFRMTKLGSEECILTSFLLNKDLKNPPNWNHVFNNTVRFMPVIKVFDFEMLPKKHREKLEQEGKVPESTKDIKRMQEMLGIIFKEINGFRNDYSHYYSTITGTNRKIEVGTQLAVFLNDTFNLAIEYTKARMSDVLKDKDYSLVENKVMVNSDNEITTHGLVFLICMFLECEQAYQFISQIEGLRGTQYSSFIATHEVFMAFCVKLPHDKFASEDLKKSLTLDMINELNRCPGTLYEVITEGGKSRFIPEIEYEKKENIIKNSLDDKITDEWDESSYLNYIRGLTKRVRYDDRFAYFAMRYIDEMNIFKELRFHINLGKLELANYEKELAGEKVERRVVESAKAFGKLSEFEDEASVYQRIDNKNLTPGFEQFAPHYNIRYNNKNTRISKIGLKKRERSSTAILYKNQTKTSKVQYRLNQPKVDAFLSLHELPKIILLEYLENGKAEEIINTFITFNEKDLLNKVFIEEVKKKLPDDWDVFYKKSFSKKTNDTEKGKIRLEFYQKMLHNRKDVLNEVLKEYDLNDKQVPTHILNYWLNISDVGKERSFSDRVKLMKRDCMDRLKVMEKHKNNPAVRTPKVGEMATFLAKDIVDMIIDKERKEKITSFYYDKMQECLAFYADDEKKKLFGRLLKELRLLEVGGHPFLSNVMREKPYNTVQFYINYLQEKANKNISVYNNKKKKNVTKDVSWMMKTFYTIELDKNTHKPMTVVRMPDDKSNIPFTIIKWEKGEKDLDEWLNWVTTGTKDAKGKRGVRKPLDLPTNLFDEKLCELLSEKLTEKDIEFDTGLNCNELFKLWWESRDDTTQDFYRFEREYEIYDEKINFIPNTAKTFKSYYETAFKRVSKRNKQKGNQTDKQLESVFKKAIAGTEKDIRFLQEEDCITLLMVEQMMGGIENVKLSIIDNLLNEQVPARLSLVYKIPPIKRTIVTECKIKNYTQLQKYRFDRRLPALLEYHKEEEVQLEWLKKQLESYNKAKQDILDNVFELEKLIIKKDLDGVKKLFVDKHGNINSGNIEHKPYLAWLRNKGIIDENEEEFLICVRNKFSHNQFPEKNNILKVEGVEWNNDLPIAEQISKVYKLYIDNIFYKVSK